jgi:uncharacterized membrane protein YfcA
MEEIVLIETWWMYALYVLGGFTAGFINVLAGNGSAITLMLMIFSGMPTNIANGTNRLGATLQTITSVLSLRRTPRTMKLVGDNLWSLLPASLGSLIGAFLVVDIPELLLRRIIGFLMLGILITLFLNPKKWKISTEPYLNRKNTLNWFLFFLLGIYAGFIQMGIGIIMLSIFVLIFKYSIKDANMLKLLVAVILSLPAFFFFVAQGIMIWKPAIALSVGQIGGAFVATRYVLYHKGLAKITTYLLKVILIFSILKLFDVL